MKCAVIFLICCLVIICQQITDAHNLERNFKYMGYRPLADRDIFRSDAWSEEHCVYICVGNEHCRALTYSGDLCVGYRSGTHSSDPVDGDIALQMACTYSAKNISYKER